MDEAKQVFGGDRFHGEGVALLIGEVDEVGLVVEGHEDGSDLAALELEGLVGLFVGCGLGLGEGDEVVVLDLGHDSEVTRSRPSCWRMSSAERASGLSFVGVGSGSGMSESWSMGRSRAAWRSARHWRSSSIVWPKGSIGVSVQPMMVLVSS